MTLPQVRSIVLVDGENLVFRFQNMVKSGEYWPQRNVIYAPDILVWHKTMFTMWESDYFRINYFQALAGDENAFKAAHETISQVAADRSQNPYRYCQLTPSIFKKSKKENRTRIVDIHLTIEAMRMAYTDQVEIVCIVSGDGDFLPLIEDIKRRGKMVIVAALDSGRNHKITSAVDRFIDLDTVLLTDTRDAQHEAFYEEFYARLPKKKTGQKKQRARAKTHFKPDIGIVRRLKHDILTVLRSQ